MSNARLKVRGRRPLSVLNAGSNRAARANVVAYRDFNRSSEAREIVPTYVDPVPGRATAMARLATDMGIAAEAVEGRVEDVLDAEVIDAVEANVDSAGTIASLIEGTNARQVPLVGQLVVELPQQRTIGIRFALRPDEAWWRSVALLLFQRLQAVTAQTGSDAIFGPQARGRGSVIEPLLRESFADHTRRELHRVFAGVLPEQAPLDVTDGLRAMPLLVTEGNGQDDPIDVVLRAPSENKATIVRGQTFYVAELAPEHIRLHEARLRRTDGRIDVQGSSVIDEKTLAAARRESSALGSALAARNAVPGENLLGLVFGAVALGLAAGRRPNVQSERPERPIEALRSDELSRTSPIHTTD